MRQKKIIALLSAAALTVGLLPAAAAENTGFIDVEESDWFCPYVQIAVEKGFMSGTGEDRFSPELTTSRAMLVQILYAMEGKPEVKAERNPFTDVDEEDWYRDAVLWAYGDGVTKGISETEFGPAMDVTREQAALLLYAYVNKPETEGTLTDFADEDSVSSWAETAMCWAVEYGILSGAQEGDTLLLNPGKGTTRAELSAMMTAFYSYLEEYGKCETPIPDPSEIPENEVISWDSSWDYASYSAIHDDTVTLYRAQDNRKNITVAVNAGHGTSDGESVKTLCHPDGSAKVTDGTTAKGATKAYAIASGTDMADGSQEAEHTLSLALLIKERLLEEGYDVLMIRETSDCRLDNIARTVFANENADCHISLHYDSTNSDKGFFYVSVPENKSYRTMEPVVYHYKEHAAFGEAILAGMKEEGVKIFGSGSMAIDLTQTSYSTIPSLDLEVGDRVSDCSEKTQSKLADGIVLGINNYFKED